ncbi:MAG TPA: TlpA disulfide reductase family protein [Candidatus Limnocylindrales bacterium]|nr:TlpA disulfide reductase family protein [Candidatus Limnocylindrales bacterium]
MKVPILIGAVAALLIGIVAVAGLLSSLSARAPTVPPAPTSTIASGEYGLYTPPPTAQPSLAASPSLTPRPGATVAIGTEPGQRAPLIQLPHLAGGTIDSGTVTASRQPLWVNFMATWCPPCRDELPMMQRFHLRLTQDLEQEIEIILVNVAEDPDEVLNFMLELGVDLPVALDQDARTQAQWGAFAMPVHFFIDENGVVQEVVFGGAPREIYVQAIQTVLPEVDADDLDLDGAEPEPDQEG